MTNRPILIGLFVLAAIGMCTAEILAFCNQDDSMACYCASILFTVSFVAMVDIGHILDRKPPRKRD